MTPSAPQATRVVPTVTPVSASVNPAAQSVRAMPAYKQVLAARARGRIEEAQAILARLADSPNLNAEERAFCRNEMK